MNKFTKTAALGALTLAVSGAVLAGEATVYSQRDFRGKSLTLNAPNRNIGDRGIREVSSIVVKSGRWQFCARPDFGGECEILGPGRYSSLKEDWSHPIESVREMTKAVANAPAPAPVPGREREFAPPRQAAVELYAGPRFQGRATPVNRDMPSLERRGANESVSSIVVNEGRWEVCTDRGFEGHCRVFNPGEYRQLGRRLDNQVSSIRRVG